MTPVPLSSLDRLQAAVDSDRSRADLIAVAALLELGTQLTPDDPRWRHLAERLVAARHGAGWGDTLTTASVVRGLAAHVVSPPPDKVSIAVLVDGREAGRLNRGDQAALTLHVAADQTVVLHPEQAGCVDSYAAIMEAQVDGTAMREATKPQAEMTAPAAELRARMFSLGGERRELLAQGSEPVEIPRGATLEIDLEVKLNQPLTHTRVTLPRPCGVELVEGPRLIDGVAALEERDDAWHVFVDCWPAGVHKLRFLVRAEIAGHISAPPPELAPMYADPPPISVSGRTVWLVK